jgi:ABC-type antimicrobial peptide transport system permease subunit
VLSGRLLESLVDGAKSVNAPAYVAALLFITSIAAIGIWVATRPIARLDIVEILRAD